MIKCGNTLLLLVCLALFSGPLQAAKKYRIVTVADPYIELHTGPHRGYPITQVVDRGDAVSILKRRTDWFKVRSERGYEGWVKREQMARTLQSDGDPTRIEDPQFADYGTRRWEAGAMSGDFGGANVISVYGGFALTPNLTIEASLAQALGSFSNSTMYHANIVHYFFPEWRATPFFTLGSGVIRTEPNATLVLTEDRSDPLGHVGLGVRAYLARRFMLRAEYKSYVVFTSRDDNEEIDEWKVGFAFFF